MKRFPKSGSFWFTVLAITLLGASAGLTFCNGTGCTTARRRPRPVRRSEMWDSLSQACLPRNPTVSEAEPPALETIEEPRNRPILREDVQVILTALGGRRGAGIDLEKATETFRLELHHADLGGAHLPSASLCRANLGGANMRGAYLCDADFSEAYLQGADLQRGNLIQANLSGARLGANLAGAIAQGADFSSASLETRTETPILSKLPFSQHRLSM